MGDEAKKEGQQIPEETQTVELSNQDLDLVAGGTEPGHHVDLHDLQVVKRIDKASPKLYSS